MKHTKALRDKTYHTLLPLPQSLFLSVAAREWKTAFRSSCIGVLISSAGASFPGNVSSHVRAITVNVDGLGDYSDCPGTRMKTILMKLMREDPHVIMLQ